MHGLSSTQPSLYPVSQAPWLLLPDRSPAMLSKPKSEDLHAEVANVTDRQTCMMVLLLLHAFKREYFHVVHVARWVYVKPGGAEGGTKAPHPSRVA